MEAFLLFLLRGQSGWRAVTRNGLTSGRSSADYEDRLGPNLQETSVGSDYPPGLIVLSTRKSLKFE